ncbi:MAG: helix-turn-helix domain-containing protein [Muribaculaceae bacterium]|nr:helix-turn-helix domain-containing protein [Muribaculaceae bacterium]
MSTGGKRVLTVVYCLMALLLMAAQAAGDATSCPLVKIEAERLADLNIPRDRTLLLCLNGEPTVIGSHTTNFVPTPTIEYYKDGKWYVVQTAYTHDDGFAVELSTGKVLIFGGHERNLGVGQSYEAELYDPVTHTCEGIASLDSKRAISSALALDDGRAVIAGNWYHKDAIEMYDGENAFSPVKGVSLGRACPFILRTAKDDAIIFGGLDSIGRHITSDVVDRLHGESYHEPLLQEWELPHTFIHKSADYSFIGDESRGEYTYLLALENAQGQIAIARVTNGVFSLLPTDVPVPMACEWGGIDYYQMVFVDRQAGMAYMLGCDAEAHNKKPASRAYVLKIDYTTTPARLTLCYTEVISPFNPQYTIVTADGNLMMVTGNMVENNFKPSGATWLLHVSPRAHEAGTGFPLWGWVLIGLAIVALAALLIMLSRRRRSDTPAVSPNGDIQETPDAGTDDIELMQRICQLMEQQQLFMNPNLKITDLAAALSTNRSAISACINSQRNCSFPQFVNAYRLNYAMELLRNQPDIKIAEVCVKSGFSSEASFYRLFKAFTGTTPNAWKSK